MLAKLYRLPPQQKFLNAKNFSYTYFRVLVRPNGLTHNRYGFVITKKIDTRAVVRNKLRRVLSGTVQSAHLKNLSGRDVLFLLKKNFLEEKPEIIQAMIQEVLAKL